MEYNWQESFVADRAHGTISAAESCHCIVCLFPPTLDSEVVACLKKTCLLNSWPTVSQHIVVLFIDKINWLSIL